MGRELNQDTLNKAYARWAPVYDGVFGLAFARGRAVAIEAAERIGGRILEVGVGTGIALPEYARHNRLVGVDYSEAMLRKAQARVMTQKLDHVEGLAVMNGTRLGFPDETFDVVVAQYVITAVPDPEGTLDELARVLRPGGEIILINHLGAETGSRRVFEFLFAPLAAWLGWSPDFPFARLAAWAQRASGISLIERRPMLPLGHFSLIRFGKTADAAELRLRAAQ